MGVSRCQRITTEIMFSFCCKKCAMSSEQFHLKCNYHVLKLWIYNSPQGHEVEEELRPMKVVSNWTSFMAVSSIHVEDSVVVAISTISLVIVFSNAVSSLENVIHVFSIKTQCTNAKNRLSF